MLVLSRKETQRILVGDDIRITVVRAERGRVRLGIEAPAGVTILREEVAPSQELRPRGPSKQLATAHRDA